MGTGLKIHIAGNNATPISDITLSAVWIKGSLKVSTSVPYVAAMMA